jgi:hypothetical protein
MSLSKKISILILIIGCLFSFILIPLQEIYRYEKEFPRKEFEYDSSSPLPESDQKYHWEQRYGDREEYPETIYPISIIMFISWFFLAASFWVRDNLKQDIFGKNPINKWEVKRNIYNPSTAYRIKYGGLILLPVIFIIEGFLLELFDFDSVQIILAIYSFFAAIIMIVIMIKSKIFLTENYDFRDGFWYKK